MSPRLKKTALTPESLEQLLEFLGPDRDAAAKKYVEIETRLIKIFACRGAADPEELAAETMDRVAKKCGEIARDYVGDRALYFLGVARYVFHESVRRGPRPLPMPEPDPWEEKELMDRCLAQCMQRLTRRNRRMIVEYYRGEKRVKIERRKVLAKELGIGLNALRIRACRVRANLQQCVFECVEVNHTW